MQFLTVSNLHSLPQTESFTVKNINFTQAQNQHIAITGETGSGKTTLLKMIAGLLQPATGTIIFENEKVLGPDYQLIPGQKDIAYLSQHFELRHHYRMEELLAFNNNFSNERSKKLYELCRIQHLMKRRHNELSGGEKQRIALAKLLVARPHLLLLDEPFSNLDLIHKNILKVIIKEVAAEFNISIILTSHDPADTLPWADLIIVMQQGEIAQKDSPAEIYYNPVNEYCAGLCGMYNVFDEDEINTVKQQPGYQNKIGKKIIRPENIILSRDYGAIKGTITGIQFCGAFYLVEILSAQLKKIIVQTNNSSFAKGDSIFFDIDF